MGTVHFRSLAMAAIAAITFAGTAAAQEASTGILNSLEVRQLVARGEPEDNARLNAHFSPPEPTKKDLAALAAKASTPADHRALEEYFRTLAARYATDAEAHNTFAQALRGTRIEQSSVLHIHLAELSRDAAKEASAAADMHKPLADTAR